MRPVFPWRVVAVIALLLVCVGTADAQSGQASWSEPVDLAVGTGEGTDTFAILIVDRWQNTHLLWGKQHASGSAIYYSNDVGGVWRQPIDVLSMPDQVAIRLSCCLTPDDVLHLVWQNLYIGGDTYYSSVSILAAADPRAWSERKLVLENAGGQLSCDANGDLYLLYGTSLDEGLGLELNLVTSADGGETWTDPSVVHSTRVPSPSGISGLAAIDPAGILHVGVTIRSSEYGAYSEIGYTRSTDMGTSWSRYQLVDNQGTTFQGVYGLAPYVIGDRVHLTWHDPRRMHMWSEDGGQSWTTPVEIMSLGAGFAGPIQLVEDATGKLHTAMTTGAGVYECTFDGARWGGCQAVDTRPLDPHFATLVLSQGNLLQVAYHDRLGDGTVWYASRLIDAPVIPRDEVPQPTEASAPLRPTSTPAQVSAVAHEEAEWVPETEMDRSTTTTGRSSMFWLWAPQVLVVAIVAMAVVIYRRRQ